jgi:dephospho-CoA kinase
MVDGADRRRPRAEGPVAVGLTGGLAAGKTTALRLFSEAGAVTVSADDVVHRLYERDDVLAAVSEHFGDGVVGADGTVDRRALGARVSGDREGLCWLEGLVHPLVSREFDHVLATTHAGGVVVFEVPLLFESRLQGSFDLVVTVEAPRELRTARAIARDGGRVFEALDAAQFSTERRLAASDVGYFNDGDLDGLRAFVADVMARALAIGRASADDSAALL